MTQEFGDAFERLRVGRGLSPAELARELDEYEGNISRWRRGGGIDVVRVRKIADYFGVDRGWLEGLAGYPPSAGADVVPVDPLTASIASGWGQMDEATREVAERGARALFATSAAANTPGATTANHSGSPINGRRKGPPPVLQSHQRWGAGILAAICSPFARSPVRLQTAATC